MEDETFTINENQINFLDIPLSKDQIKEMCIQQGADLVGIASADSFTEAPEGVHPNDVLPTCKSVIVLCCEFPKDSVNHDAATYTSVRNKMTDKMNSLAKVISKEIKAKGYDSHAVTSITSSWINGRNRGPISLKHAGVLAGLGRIGKNTLLVNDKYGNMIWLSAVLTSIPLESDSLADYTTCRTECSLCIDNCPSKALGSKLMNQRACLSYAFKRDTGVLEIQCWKCRQICPKHLGIANK